jgi:hypothetical protein
MDLIKTNITDLEHREVMLTLIHRNLIKLKISKIMLNM